MPRQPRPQCRICARKLALDTTGQCYDCKAKPPKFRICQKVEWFRQKYSPMERVSQGIFTVSKIGFSLDYGWEYGVKERVSWRINEKHLRSVANG